MDARTRDLRTLKPLAFRTLSGAIADVWHVHGERGGGGFYVAPDPRIVVFLDEVTPAMALRTSEHGMEHIGTRAMFVPAGVPLWSRLGTGQPLSHIDFHLEAGALQARAQTVDVRVPQQARFVADNEALLSIARLAASEVETPRRGEMMLDGLLQALLGELIDTPTDRARPQLSGGLSAHQMQALDQHLHRHLDRAVSVAELAEVVGLSESWFSRAFKATTGQPPIRWIAEQRVQAAQHLMGHSARLPLADVALATGFADQSHLSRAFRRHVGLTPSQWRRSHQGDPVALPQPQKDG
ncbi:helix-turn-helix domain-containing protein [Celeribacter sp. ULVN23_4]